MKTKKQQPKYMIIYQCQECGHESGYTELDKPMCRYCQTTTDLTVSSKQEITPELVMARLKKSTDNMMKNLEGALKQVPDFASKVDGDPDTEADLLKLMARAKEFHDKVHGLRIEDNKIV